MNAVLISLLTSVIVSLMTFVLGLKAGKNQTDRVKLQELYKRLFSYFSELESGINEYRPKQWTDFKKIENGSRTRYYPDVREMERTGDLLFLNKNISKHALALELDCLKYEGNLKKMCYGLHDFFLQSEKMFMGPLEVEPSGNNNNNRIKTDNPKLCKTYRTEPYGIMFNKERLVGLLNDRDNSELDYAISFCMRGNPPERSVTIYPQSLAVENEMFANIIMKHTDGSVIEEEKDLLIKRIGKMKRRLASKARNPVGFWETFFGAFLDVFRN